MTIFLSILLLISAIFLIVAVLLQSGKSKGVSSAISGGSQETYFGKNKGKSFDKKLSLLTTIVAIVFVLLAIVVFITQDFIENDFTPSTTTSSSTTSSSGLNGSNDVLSGVDSGNIGGSNDVETTTSSVVAPSNDVE